MGCRDSKLKEDYDPGSAKIEPVLKVLTLEERKTVIRNKSVKTRPRKRRKKRDQIQGRKSSSSELSRGKRTGHSNTRSSTNRKPKYDPRITAKYDIKAVIGKGSYSRVVRVEHRITKQPYAIKMIEAVEGRELFEAELSVLRRVNHPNVIRLMEVFELNDRIYMVMELATGGNLLDRIEAHGPFLEPDAIRVMQMVLSGLNYLHNLGITHRDLKPDNLLYYHPGSDSRILITDFGFASTRKPNGNIYMHTVCGTPQYVAPEIVSRRPYTSAIDLWALGVITYVLLCGRFPFDSKQNTMIFKLILKGNYKQSGEGWDDLSNSGKDFIRQLLQRDPRRRMTAVQALRHPWITGDLAQDARYDGSSPKTSESLRSSGSGRSAWSGRSQHSLRSGHHNRVKIQHLEALSADPEVAEMLQRVQLE